MEVNSSLINFPLRNVSETEYFNRARRAAHALARGYTDIAPRTLYGPHKERISLMRWTTQGQSRMSDEAGG